MVIKGRLMLTVMGAFKLQSSSEIHIGNSSPSYLNISDGGKLTASQAAVYVGGRGGQGEVNVFGPNSVLMLSSRYWCTGKRKS